jgi:hypothetical protein
MSIQQIGFDSGPQGLDRSRERRDKLASHVDAGAQLENSSDDSVRRAGIAKRAAEFNRLSAQDDRTNAVASHIRTIDKTMETVGTTVKAMRRELEGLVKSYPPYSSDTQDQERARRLKGYAGLRAMIDRLTVPPKESMHQREAEIDKLMPDDYTTIVDSKGMTKTVLKEDLHVGPSGIYIPQLLTDGNVDDATVQQAMGQLDQATAAIDARRESLRTQATVIGESRYGTSIGELSAGQVSMQLGRDLAGQPVGIAHESTAQLEQLLG